MTRALVLSKSRKPTFSLSTHPPGQNTFPKACAIQRSSRKLRASSLPQASEDSLTNHYPRYATRGLALGYPSKSLVFEGRPSGLSEGTAPRASAQPIARRFSISSLPCQVVCTRASSCVSPDHARETSVCGCQRYMATFHAQAQPPRGLEPLR